MSVAAATLPLRSELPVFVLTGPTGVGKSDWAIRLANEAAVEIVSECATELTICGYEATWVRPCPSLAVTWIVHVCGVPVLLAGAVHVGDWIPTLLKVPLPDSVEQVACQL